MVETITSYATTGAESSSSSSSSSSGTPGDALNQVLFEYDDFGKLVKEYQEHDGTKDADTPYVGYNYGESASGGRFTKGLRPTSVRYPNGRLVHYTYGDSGSIADAMNRIDAIKDDDSGSPGDTLAQYSYLGAGTIVVEDYTEPDVKLDYVGDGSYSGFDRFGRVVDQKWYDYGASAVRDQYTYGYDRAGNRLYRENTTTSGKDEYYTYDGINRLVNFDRGDLNAQKTAISGTPGREEDFALDPTGNWTDYVQKTSGTTDLDQGRTHNKVNEITDVTETVGTAWITPLHDKAGNMTTLPKPSSPTAGLACQYDAWNRLVEVTDGQTVVGKYEYDGLGRRVKKHLDSQSPESPNGIDTYVHYFYDRGWQVLETRETDTETAGAEILQPKYQHVWSRRYIDAPILRDENTDQDGLCDDERLYYLADANFNVTTLVDTGGDAVERYVYAPYGRLTIYDGAWSSTRSTSSYNNTILYTGREYNSHSGVYYYRARYYDTHMGRFITCDPIGYADGPNRYRYGRANPVARTDPSGTFPKDPTGELCHIGGHVVSSRHFGTILFWAGIRVTPEVTEAGLNAANAIADGLNLYDELPDEIKPPIGVAPGTADAATSLAGMAMGLYDPAAKRDGVRIWVKIACKRCECKLEGWFRWRWVLRWRELEPVMYLCSAVEKKSFYGGFDLVRDEDVLKKAIPKCVREASKHRDCYKSSKFYLGRPPSANPPTS